MVKEKMEKMARAKKENMASQETKGNGSSGKRGEGRGSGGHHREEGGQQGSDGKEKNKDNDKGKGVSTGEKGTDGPNGSAGAGGSDKAGQQGTMEGETGSTQALMSEVTSLLRSLRMDPQMKVMRVKKLEVGDVKTTLLDGGATHCLRPAKSRQEWETSMECQVSLASGKIWMRMNKKTGTLLTLDRTVQRIIPIRELLRLGMRVTWEENMIKITRTDGSQIPVWLDNGCPVVSEKTGDLLMEEVEANNKFTAGIQKICVNVNDSEGAELCGEEAVTNAKELYALFPDVPPRLLAKVPGAVDLDMAKVPLNRRVRRRIRESSTRILHLFAGERTRMWTQMNDENLIIVCIELEKGLDLHGTQLFGYLEQCARDGLWDMVVGGPPCRTVSLSRHRGDDGPRPLRSREGEGRFGLGWNTATQQEKVDGDSILFLKMLWICYLSKIGNPKCESMLEQPADPEQWLPEDQERPLHGYPSFLAWEETQRVCEILNLKRVDIDQDALGHERVKPTTLLTDVPEVLALHGTRCTTRSSNWPQTLEERLEASKRAAAWAEGLVKVLQRAILRKQGQAVYGPRAGQLRKNPEAWEEFLQRRDEGRRRLGLPPLPDERLALRALAGRCTELEEWQRHVDNNHMPFRRDCQECLRARGRDRMRKRIEHPDSYTLNLDIMGPVNRGEDQDGSGFYYALVGAYTVPCVGTNPIAQGLQELGHQAGLGITVDEGKDVRPWTSQDVEKEINELEKGLAPKVGENVKPGEVFDQNGRHAEGQRSGEDDGSDHHLPGLHDGQCAGEDDGGDHPLPGLHEVLEDESVDGLFEGQPQAPEQWTEIEVQQWGAMNRRWQEKIAGLKNVKVTTLTFAVPMRSRHSHEVVRALSLMYGKLRALNLPLVRVHSDRARELLAKPVQQWLQSRDVMQTVAAGDEAQGSGRVEKEVQF